MIPQIKRLNRLSAVKIMDCQESTQHATFRLFFQIQIQFCFQTSSDLKKKFERPQSAVQKDEF